MTSTAQYSVHRKRFAFPLLGLAAGALVLPHVAMADTTISTSAGPQTWTSDDFLVTDTGAINGGGANAIEVTAPGSGMLTNRGIITAPAYYGISTVGGFGSIVNSGTINNVLSGIYIVNPDGGTVTNEADGIISASNVGITYAGPSLSVITNAGYLSGDYAALLSTSIVVGGVQTGYGTVDIVNNSGTMTSAGYGINAPGGIGTLNNSGTISGGSSTGSAGIYISRFGTLINDVGGTISGYNAMHNVSFDTIINRGNIVGISEGLNVFSFGTSDLIQNDGLISGRTAVDVSFGGVRTLINNGTISSDDVALAAGTSGIGTLTNNGLIHGKIVLNGSGNFPVVAPEIIIDNFVNSGTIEGDIIAKNGATLTINGGTDKRGVLTGLGGAQGLINTNFGAPALPIFDVYNAVSQDITFGSGLLLLNDTIFARNANVRFAGANVQVNNEVAVTGHVILSAGEMVFGVTAPDTYGHYVVTGDADLDAGRVSLVALGAPVFAVGQSYHLLTADSVTASDITTSVEGYQTSYAIMDNGGAYDFVVTLDGVAQAYNHLGLTAPQMALNNVAPVADAIASHQSSVKVASIAPIVPVNMQPSQGRLWGKLLFANAQRSSASGATGYDANGAGFVVGADIPVSRDVDAGLAFNWVRSIGDGKDRFDGTDVTLNTYQLTAYGTWRPASRLSIDGQLSYGFNRFDQRRSVSLIASTASADYDGDQIVGDVRIGYEVPLSSSTSLTPFADLRVVHVTTDAYSETGAVGANLTVDKFSTSSLRHELGIKLSTGFDTSGGMVTPELRLGWLHDYNDNPLSVSATNGIAAFTSATDRVDSDGLDVGFALNLAANRNVDVSLAYDGEYRSDYRSHTAVIRAALRF